MRARGTPKWKIESFLVLDASGMREIVWRSNGKAHQQLFTCTSESINAALEWSRRNRLKLGVEAFDFIVYEAFDNSDSSRWVSEMWCTQPYILYKHDKEGSVHGKR